jgi:hypothetical protein
LAAREQLEAQLANSPGERTPAETVARKLPGLDDVFAD